MTPLPGTFQPAAAAAATCLPVDIVTNPTTNKALKHKRRYCSIEGCGRIVKSQGKCQRHGAKPRPCKVEGCTKQAQGNFDKMCKAHFKAMKRETTPLPPPPEVVVQSGVSVYDGIMKESIEFLPQPVGEGSNKTMPLIAHLKEGFDALKPPAWHRNEERIARGIKPISNPATQLQGWERELVWMEILLLTGAPNASFRHLARAWGRDKGFHSVLAQFICERHGDFERKKRSIGAAGNEPPEKDEPSAEADAESPSKRAKLERPQKVNGHISADINDDTCYGDSGTNEALAADIFNFHPTELDDYEYDDDETDSDDDSVQAMAEAVVNEHVASVDYDQKQHPMFCQPETEHVATPATRDAIQHPSQQDHGISPQPVEVPSEHMPQNEAAPAVQHVCAPSHHEVAHHEVAHHEVAHHSPQQQVMAPQQQALPPAAHHVPAPQVQHVPVENVQHAQPAPVHHQAPVSYIPQGGAEQHPASTPAQGNVVPPVYAQPPQQQPPQQDHYAHYETAQPVPIAPAPMMSEPQGGGNVANENAAAPAVQMCADMQHQGQAHGETISDYDHENEIPIVLPPAAYHHEEPAPAPVHAMPPAPPQQSIAQPPQFHQVQNLQPPQQMQVAQFAPIVAPPVYQAQTQQQTHHQLQAPQQIQQQHIQVPQPMQVQQAQQHTQEQQQIQQIQQHVLPPQQMQQQMQQQFAPAPGATSQPHVQQVLQPQIQMHAQPSFHQLVSINYGTSMSHAQVPPQPVAPVHHTQPQVQHYDQHSQPQTYQMQDQNTLQHHAQQPQHSDVSAPQQNEHVHQHHVVEPAQHLNAQQFQETNPAQPNQVEHQQVHVHAASQQESFHQEHAHVAQHPQQPTDEQQDHIDHHHHLHEAFQKEIHSDQPHPE